MIAPVEHNLWNHSAVATSPFQTRFDATRSTACPALQSGVRVSAVRAAGMSLERVDRDEDFAMMNFLQRRWYELTSASGATLVLGGCLSDQELTQIFSTVITSGLSTILEQIVIGIVGSAGGA